MPQSFAYVASRLLHVAILAGVLWLLVYAVFTLTREPCLGVADNQDYWRVMRPAGIDHLGPLDRPGAFIRCTFQLKEADFRTGLSSSALLAWAAKHVGWGLSTLPGSMDLRQMGLLHLAILAALVVLWLASRAPSLLLLCVMYILADPGYLLFFNSFYADSALFLAVVGVTLWLLRWGSRPWELWQGPVVQRTTWAGLLLLLVALGGASKMQYVLLPVVVLGVLGATFAATRRWPGRGSLLLALLLVTFSGTIFWHFFYGGGPRFPLVNNYHAVYAGILRMSGSPEAVLQELAIPKRYWNLPRKDIFSARVARNHPVHEYLARVSRSRLALLYLREPRAIGAVMAEVQGVLARRSPHTRGNYVRSETHPRRSVYETPWQFSRWRSASLAAWPPMIWLFTCGGLLWLGAAMWTGRWNSRKVVLLFLLVWFLSQVVVAVLGDGLVALEQHLLSARLALDLFFLIFVLDLAAAAMASRRQPLSNEEGCASPQKASVSA